jgi:hypothetical protein
MRKAVTLVIILAVAGVVLGLGSVAILTQDNGSCPAQPVGSPFTCDHAYFINGTYVWMRPVYTGLGIASLVFLALTAVLVFYVRFGGRPSPGQRTATE